MQLVGGEEFSALFVAHKGIAFPRIPQPFHHLQIFAGNAVTLVVFWMGAAREVFRRTFQRRRHHVPADATAAQMIEAGELARHGKRLAVGGGKRSDQTDFLGHQRQRRQQGDRLKTVEEVRNRLRRDVQAIGDKQEIDLRLLSFARQIQHVIDVNAGIRHRIGMTPCRHVAGYALNNRAQPQLALCLTHSALLIMRSRAASQE